MKSLSDRLYLLVAPSCLWGEKLTRALLFMQLLFFASLACHAQTSNVVFTTNTTITATNTSYDDQNIIISNATVSINGHHSFNSLHVFTNGVVTEGAGQTNLNLTIAGDLVIDSGGVLSVDGKGFAHAGIGPGSGPGGGGGSATDYSAGGGGGYGGEGGRTSNGQNGGGTYGSLATPVDWGSAGGTGHDAWSGSPYPIGPGGDGGGALRVQVAGQLLVNGRISADGGDGQWAWYTGGGGSGGSVWIDAGQLGGTGTIRARGGSSPSGPYQTGGGGGGGRIALFFTSNIFSGNFSGVGGSGSEYGGAGSIYTKASRQAYGELRFDNGGNDGSMSSATASNVPPQLERIIITGQAQVNLPPGFSLTVGDLAGSQGRLTIPTNTVLLLRSSVLTLQTNLGVTVNGQLLYTGNGDGKFTRVEASGGALMLGLGGQLGCGELRIENNGMFVLGASNTFRCDDLEVLSGGTLLVNRPVALPYVHIATNGVVTQGAGPTNLNLTIEGDLVIDSGGVLSVDGKGFAHAGVGPGNGPGGGGGSATDYSAGGGGGYGGQGGRSSNGQTGGGTYGSLATPVDWGSAGGTGHDAWSGSPYPIGPGGDGGGALRVQVARQLLVNGRISADGGDGQWAWYTGGGGSGGSVWLDAGQLGGTGKIRARGGSSPSGPYQTGGGGGGGRIALFFTINLFSGNFSGVGGSGSEYGGAGSIYTQASRQAYGELRFDNGGNDGSMSSATASNVPPQLERIIITGQAQVNLPPGFSLTVGDLAGSQGRLTIPTNTVLLLRSSVLTLQTNLGVTVNGQLLYTGNGDGKFTRVEASGGALMLGLGGQLGCGELRIENNGMFVLGASNTFRCDDLEVLSGGTLLVNRPVALPYVHIATNGVVTQGAGPTNLNLTIEGDLVIDSGGVLSVDGKGFAHAGVGPGNGPGGGGGSPTDYSAGGGGGYGGQGGRSSNGQ